MQKSAFSKGGRGLESTQNALTQMGRKYAELAAASGNWMSIEKKIANQANAYTDALIKQKNSLRELLAARKSGLAAQAYQDQLALKNAQVSTLARDKSGNHMAQMLVPAQASKGLDTMANRAGFAASQLRNASTQMVNLGKNTQWAGRQLTVGFTVPLMAVGAGTAYLANQMDTELTRIAKVYDTTAHNNMSMADQQVAKEKELAQVRVDAIGTARDAAKQYGASLQNTLNTQAQLAATGVSGKNLQQSTTEAMRLATLGEMDYQKSVDTTIALQTTFKMSSDQLANSINYMNAVENATSLSLEDFATAIPIAAGPIKSLGGDIKDLGTLLVAMRSQGVDAAEGANAIKASFTRVLNPSKAVVEQFESMTGKNLPDLVKETKGELIPTFQAIGKAVQNLDNLSRTQVLSKLFGTYQNARLNAALNGIVTDLDDTTTQVGKAYQLMGADQRTLAEKSAQEIDRWQASASGRFKVAAESIKVSLAVMGQGFLDWGAKLLTGANKALEVISGMPEWFKDFAKFGIIAGAIIGPTVMLAGLFANLFGTIAKGLSMIVLGATRFKLLSQSEVMATRVAALQSKMTDSQTRSTMELTDAVQQLNQAFRDSAKAAGLMNNATGAQIAARAKALAAENAKVSRRMVEKGGTREVVYSGRVDGKFMSREDSRIYANATKRLTDPRGRPTGKTMDELHASANAANKRYDTKAQAKEAERVAAATEKSAGNTRTMAAGGALFTAGMIGSIAPLNDGASKLAQWAMITGMLVPSFAGIGKGAKFIGAGMAATGKNMSGALKAAGPLSTRVKGMGSALLSGAKSMNLWVLGLAAAAGGAYLLYKRLSKGRDEQRKMNEDATELGKIFGFTAKEAARGIGSDAKNPLSQDRKRVQELSDAYPALISRMTEARKVSEKELFNVASQQGFKAFDAGATVEQAREVVRTALMAANKTAEEAEAIMLKFDFDVNDMKQRLAVYQRQLQDAVDESNSGNGFIRNPWGDYGASDTSAAGKSLGKIITSMIDNGDVRKAMDTLKKQTDVFNQNLAKARPEEQDEMRDNFITALGKEMGASKKETEDLVDEISRLQMMVGNGGDLKVNVNDLLGLDNSGAMKDLQKWIDIAEKWQATRKLLDQGVSMMPEDSKVTIEQQKEILDLYLAGKDLTAEQRGILMDVQSITGARFVIEDRIREALGLQNDELAKTPAGQQAAIAKRDQILANMKTALSAADADYTKRADALDKAQKNRLKGMEAAAQAREDAFEAASRRMEARHQRESDALEKRQQKEQRAFDKAWDKRIAAAQKEEDLRKRMFDAERNRIKRMQELQNSNIDFNRALNTGNLDEAAKIRNNQQASNENNQLDDTDSLLSDRAAAKQDALGNARDKASQKLGDRQDAESKALRRSQELQKQQLADAKEHAQRLAQVARDGAEEQFQAQKDALKKEHEERKKNFQKAMMELQAFAPKNEKELQAQLIKLKAKYGTFGGEVTNLGRAWSKAIADAMVKKMDKASRDMSHPEKWLPRGADAAEAWMKGLQKETGVTGSDIKSFLKNQRKHVTNPSGKTGTQANHEGGFASPVKGRTGYPAKAAPYPSEQLRLLKNDEFVMKGSAVRKYGPDMMNAINQGKADIMARHVGGPVAEQAAQGSLELNAITGTAMKRAAQMAADEKKKQAAQGRVGKGGSMKGVDPNGWNKPWKGHYTTNNGHDYPLVYKSLYAPHSGRVRAHAIPGHEPRVGHGGHGFKSYGQYVDFDGGGTNLMFAHLSKLPVAAGKSMHVKAGQYMGTTGETGNAHGAHVHVERNHTGDNSQFGQFFRSKSISLAKGTERVRYDGVMANLHKDESVLTDDISAKFREGVDRFADGPESGYTSIKIYVDGATMDELVPRVQTAVETGIKKAENRFGKRGKKK